MTPTLQPGAEDTATARRASRPWRDFQIVLVSGLLLLVLILLGDAVPFLQPLRIILGLAWVLFVPGYCLVSALFARTADLDGVARIGASIGLSVALVPVLALILDKLPWGIRLWPILIAEFVTSGIFVAMALWRRARLPVEVAYAPELELRPRQWWHSQAPDERRIYGFLALALVLVSLAGAWALLAPSADQYMTEFYVLGKAGLAEDYPREAAPGQTLTVTMGIANHERSRMAYRVEVWLQPDAFSAQRQLLETAGPFTLDPGQKREQPLAWRMPAPDDDQIVQFLLKVDDQPDPYRQLRLWVNVKDAETGNSTAPGPATHPPLPATVPASTTGATPPGP